MANLKSITSIFGLLLAASTVSPATQSGVFYPESYTATPAATQLDQAWAAAVAYQKATSQGPMIELGAATYYYNLPTTLVQPAPLSFGGVVNIHGQGRYATIVAATNGTGPMLSIPTTKPAANWPSFRVEGVTFNGGGVRNSCGDVSWWINGGMRDVDCVNLASGSDHNWKFGDPTSGNAQELRFEGLYASSPTSTYGMKLYVSDSTLIDAYPQGQSVGIQTNWDSTTFIHAHPTGNGIGIQSESTNNIFNDTECDTISTECFDIEGMASPQIWGTNPYNMLANSTVFFFGDSATPLATIMGTASLCDGGSCVGVYEVKTTNGIWPKGIASGKSFDVMFNPVYTPAGTLLGGATTGTFNVTGTLTTMQ